MLGSSSKKSISVRFNLSRENERKLYEEVMSHNREIPDDPYGSSGAFVKAAVRFYMQDRDRIESENRSREQLQEYIDRSVEAAGEVFLKKLQEHDQSRMLENLTNVVKTIQSGGGVVPDIRTDEGSSPDDTAGMELKKKSRVQEVIDRLDAESEEQPPADALSYLSQLG